MSSFKRRTPSKPVALPPGTRACPVSTSTVLTSSGIPSLDDILGGGVPLSCSLAILAPDSQSAYGELVQKHFVAQGIASGHRVCIIHDDALSFVKECMWIPASTSNHPMSIPDEDDTVEGREKVKIAWRYGQMKKFETTVTNLSTDHFCDTFDLTCCIPVSVSDQACSEDRLIPLNLTISDDLGLSMDERIKQIERALATTPSTEVVRICIPALGSPEWGEQGARDILRALYVLRRLLRRYPHACACVTLAPHFCTDLWAGSGWVQKVSWVSDGAISMSAFGANPALATHFPSHHGLVQIHKLPTPHSIIPTSDRYSTLRGLSSCASASIGTGENNLAFRCTRKRLIFETLHLDLEGGITERRTTPAVNADAGRVYGYVSDKGDASALASVAVELEEARAAIKSHSLEGDVSPQNIDSSATVATPQRAKKARKKVVFHSEKPDLYDF